MSKYIVTTKEVHAYEFSIDAKSKEEALSLVAGGDGEQTHSDHDAGFSYLYSMDTDSWDVKEVGERDIPREMCQDLLNLIDKKKKNND